MLHNRGQRDRHDRNHGSDQQGRVALRQRPESRLVPVDGQSDPACLLHRGKVHPTHDGRQHIGADYADDDGHDFHHALAPDITDDHQRDGHDGDQPVGGAVVDGGLRKGQADGDDDRPCHDGREEPHHLPCAEELDQKGQKQVHQPRAGHAEAGIGQEPRIVRRVPRSVRHRRDSRVSAQEREGGTQERGHLPLGQKVEQQCAQPREQQCGGHVKACQHGHQYGGAEHGKHVLDPQHQYLGRSQGLRIIDACVADALTADPGSRFLFLAHELFLLYPSDRSPPPDSFSPP